MNRKDFFRKYYLDGEDPSPLFDQEYRVLKNFWETIPEEYRETLFDLPPLPQKEGFEPVEIPDDADEETASNIRQYNERIKQQHERQSANVKAVGERYRFRMASEFCSDMPDIFRQVLMMSDDKETMDLLFFGTLGALSACMPNVHGSLMREEIHPSLYLFITGAAASGKGKIGICRRLLDRIDERYLLWGSPFIIPANITDTAFYEALANNGGRGILFESEADTLTAAFSKAAGKFSDGLRAAFHNEAITYMRRTNNEQVIIPHPELSMVLTGTPRQVPLLLKDPENGLFSRILFYRLFAAQESYAEEDAIHHGITGRMVNDYMDCLAQRVCDFFYQLKGLKENIEFRLTDEQQRLFMEHFREATNSYQQLFHDAYDSEEAADHAVSIMRRMGNICYRMMMVLSISRLIGHEGELPKEVVCDQRDFDRVMEMEPNLRFHNNLHYDELMVAGKVVEPLDEEEETTGDMLSNKQRDYYMALPLNFIKQEALQIGDQLSLNPRRVARYLDRYLELGILSRKKRGSYEKNTEADSKDPADN